MVVCWAARGARLSGKIGYPYMESTKLNKPGEASSLQWASEECIFSRESECGRLAAMVIVIVQSADVDELLKMIDQG